MRIDNFVKDRDYILANIEKLSVEDIERYCKKYSIPVPYTTDVMIGGLHKARLNLPSLTDVDKEQFKELQEKSKKWLDNKGWSYDIK